MKNKHTISFYHPKACQPETSATRFTPTQRPRSHSHSHSHSQRVPMTCTKKKSWGVAMSTPPLIYYSYHSYILRTCIVAGRGIWGCFECVVKEESFGLFGGLGRGSWQERKEGAGRGSEDGRGSRRWPGDCQPEGGSEGGSEGTGREVEAGRRGKACSLSERNNVERAKEGDSHREGVRVFGQQPPGVWSLSNTRDIRGLGFLWLWGGGTGLWIFGGMFCGGFGY